MAICEVVVVSAFLACLQQNVSLCVFENTKTFPLVKREQP